MICKRLAPAAELSDACGLCASHSMSCRFPFVLCTDGEPQRLTDPEIEKMRGDAYSCPYYFVSGMSCIPVVLTLIELAWSAGNKSTWLNWHCAGKVPEKSSPQGSGVHCTRAIQAVYAFRVMKYAPRRYV
jgi:hypothetical protein